MVCNWACISDPRDEDHGMVIFAIDGTPEVRAEVDKIVKDFYPNEGLDEGAAQKLMDQFTARVKVYISPESPALQDPKYTKNRGKNHYCMPAVASAVTGVISEKAGKRWITATKIGPAVLRFPSRMLAADKPRSLPDREPLTLKISDTLTLKCISIPAGKFLMGTPVYMWPYYVEEYPTR
jgi:hypothetical protein